MENMKTYTQTVISCNAKDWYKNSELIDELTTVNHIEVQVTEEEYERVMKERAEREERLKEVLAQMLVKMYEHKKRQSQ